MASIRLSDQGFLNGKINPHSFLEALSGASLANDFPDLKSTTHLRLRCLNGRHFFYICGISDHSYLGLFPNLRAHLFSPHILHGLGSLFGLPLKIDNATVVGSRPSVARVLVELDITKSYPEAVWIGPNNLGSIDCVAKPVIGKCIMSLEVVEPSVVPDALPPVDSFLVEGGIGNFNMELAFSVQDTSEGINVVVNNIPVTHASDIQTIVGVMVPKEVVSDFNHEGRVIFEAPSCALAVACDDSPITSLDTTVSSTIVPFIDVPINLISNDDLKAHLELKGKYSCAVQSDWLNDSSSSSPSRGICVVVWYSLCLIVFALLVVSLVGLVVILWVLYLVTAVLLGLEHYFYDLDNDEAAFCTLPSWPWLASNLGGSACGIVLVSFVICVGLPCDLMPPMDGPCRPTEWLQDEPSPEFNGSLIMTYFSSFLLEAFDRKGLGSNIHGTEIKARRSNTSWKNGFIKDLKVQMIEKKLQKDIRYKKYHSIKFLLSFLCFLLVLGYFPAVISSNLAVCTSIWVRFACELKYYLKAADWNKRLGEWEAAGLKEMDTRVGRRRANNFLQQVGLATKPISILIKRNAHLIKRNDHRIRHPFQFPRGKKAEIIRQNNGRERGQEAYIFELNEADISEVGDGEVGRLHGDDDLHKMHRLGPHQIQRRAAPAPAATAAICHISPLSF
ncbi:hypothetical protein IEQ34_005085 [Dendrobium chrysotoxum]|uniref:Uncharacterized protein n=1 Tax=Dendrobium chrysotoxum TaxID=161865 RepID=A0AAV7H7L1_DENCH|nr:hypothetical protein IEQ34_005085 [Dendrobium chrysotoxum]